MTRNGPPDDKRTAVEQYVNENRDLLERVLRHGNTEARGYALALLANAGTPEDVEQVRATLEDLTDDGG